jgi:hypothetical protein
MLDWLKRRASTEFPRREVCPAGPASLGNSDAAKPQKRVMSGTYVLLYKYLENRYADTVVLTFAEIEDLLGFALPEQARIHREWWTSAETSAGSNYSDSWVLASRTAVPNLMARTVVFERAS